MSKEAKKEGPRSLATPRYFEVMRSHGVERWVGIVTRATDGQMKKFYYWGAEPADLSSEEGRTHFATFLATISLTTTARDLAVGPIVRLSECDPNTNHIETVDIPGKIGVYVEASHRDLAGFKIPADMEKIQKHPELVGEAVKRILNILPHLSED
jgi:hypothetical protein